MQRMCVGCGLPVKCKKRSLCWRCHHKKYRAPKGYHGPHHCNYCGDEGHNILTCKKMASDEAKLVDTV